MRNITSSLHVARHLIETDKAWLLCLEIALKNPSGTFVRLVRNTTHLVIGGKTFLAAGFELQPSQEDGQGTLGQCRLIVPNASLVPMTFLEPTDRVLGQPMSWWIVNQSDLSSLPAGTRSDHVILKATATHKALTLECGHPATSQRIPVGVYDRTNAPQLTPGGGQPLTAP